MKIKKNFISIIFVKKILVMSLYIKKYNINIHNKANV